MPNSRLILYFHPYDIESYRVVQELVKERITAKIDMVPAVEPEVFNSGLLWSIPSVYDYHGHSLGFAPFRHAEIQAMITGTWRESSFIMSDEDQLVSTVLKSPIASAIILVHGSYKPLIAKCSFLEGALRLRLREAGCEEKKRELMEEADRLFQESWRTAAISLAYAFAREYYIGNGFYGDPLDLERVTPRLAAAWLVSTASVGKAGVPISTINMDYVEYMTGYINGMAEKMLDTIEYEFSTILMDKKYMELVEKEVKWFLPHQAES